MPKKPGKDKKAHCKETPARQITDEGTVVATPYEFAGDIMNRETVSTVKDESRVTRKENRENL